MQPPLGPPVWTALNLWLPGMPPPISKMISRNVMPIGTYGVGASAIGEGSRALAGAVQGTVSFQNNTFIGAARNGYPPTTRWAASLAAALATGAGLPSRPVP